MTCKNCIHCEVCDYWENETYSIEPEAWDGHICKYFKNIINFLELPCKVGQEIFWVTSECDDYGVDTFVIYEGKVESFSVQKEGLWAFCRYDNGLTYWHIVVNYFGKDLVLTRKEAEEKLKKYKESW
jgi:hypothetical protein